jgi:hypothetical protein
MDPIGLGLEHFDGIGRWREKEHVEIRLSTGDTAAPKKRTMKFDLSIEAHGEVAGITSATFSDPVELGRILAASPVCQQCVVRQIFRYASGRMETAGDRPTIDHLYDIFRTSGFRFRVLLMALVETPEFLQGAGNQTQIAARKAEESSGGKYGPQ